MLYIDGRKSGNNISLLGNYREYSHYWRKYTLWEDKIVGHDKVPPESLLAHPENWRIHPKFQQEALRGVIDDIGFIKSVTVNQRTGRVIDGHLRITLALRDGVPLIPVEYVDLSEEEEAEALMTLDPLASLAASDKDNIGSLIDKIDTSNQDVLKLLDQIQAQAGIIDKLDFEAEWQGMPEFEQVDMTAFQSIHLHFKTPEDVREFAELVNRKISPKTRALWFPPAPQQDFADDLYHAES